MYVNYGDRDFFENGILVDTEHSDTVFPMLLCQPYPDEEDLYQFGVCEVDIDDDWIDRKAVMKFIGMSEETFDPVQFAIGCVGFYSWDYFGATSYDYDWTRMSKADICEILKNQLIASDNLDMIWLDSKESRAVDSVIQEIRNKLGDDIELISRDGNKILAESRRSGNEYTIEISVK